MRKKILFAVLFLVSTLSVMSRKTYQLRSPDQGLRVEVLVDDRISFFIIQDDSEVMNSRVGMTLRGGEILGDHPLVSKVTKASVDKEIVSPLYKKAVVKDVYNEMRFSFSGDYGLIFRAYDEGIAYRFTTRMKDSIIVAGEEAVYDFPSGYKTFAPYVNEPVMKLDSERLNILPLLVDLGDGYKLCITEADLEDYPGMFLDNDSDTPSLGGIHASFPKVKEREDYITKTSGTRSFPWRAFIIFRNDQELADCDMVYRLDSSSRIRKR